MRKKTILALGLLAGCGSGPLTLTVAGKTLTVQDDGYFTTSGVDYCTAAAPGEMMLDFVDYNFICDPHQQPERNPAVQHLELQIVLSQANPLRDPYKPYVVGPADCTNGPTAEAIGRFLHYAANSKTPDNPPVQAESGTVTITKLPANKAKDPLVGNFDLVFNGQHVKSSFSIFACN